MGNAFHHAAIAEEYVGVVINYIMTIAIELCRKNFFSERHTDSVGDTLTKRTSGRFYTWGIAALRVAWRFRMQLTELLDVLNRQIVASQMQHRINQHRTVAIRQNKTVAIRPMRVSRVML